ncbi:MAG: DNA repair protein RadC [Acidibacillus sp.]|nr:DNA repair protein RadC [Acidibacillus sp.]
MGYRIPVVSVQMVKEKTMSCEVHKVRCVEDAFHILSLYLSGVDREHFVVMVLDTKHKVNAIHTVSIGSLDASVVHPREVLKVALLGNASSLIVAHNHPSGDPTPSTEDLVVTKRLQAACEIMGIPLLDHVIIGDERFISLKAGGYF